jgi:sugar O-acyltransferase (sialic acid O-acetyltransferase NeuD family)
MQQVVVFGNGQMASVMYFYLVHDSPFDVVAFTVDEDNIKEHVLMEVPVVPFQNLERSHPPDRFALSIPISYRQVNQLRAAKYEEAHSKGYHLINYISSRASTWPGLETGDNCIIMEGSVIQPFAKIEADVFLGCGSIVGHHCVISEHCFIAPGAVMLGHVKVGPYCFLGANSTIRDGVTVARECIIGAGVTISRNTQPKEVYVAERTEPSKKHSDELRQWLTWLR